jgi:hypothetical protein
MNSLCNLPEVLAIAGINATAWGGLFLTDSGVYPGSFSPIEKIGKELGWQHWKRLVKIVEKD